MTTPTTVRPQSLGLQRMAMRFREPFRIAGHVFEAMPSIVANLSRGGRTGRGEAAGVYYLGDDDAHMVVEVERCRAAIEGGADRATLQRLLPAGGARNAIDCAMWELESFERSIPVWQVAGMARPRAVTTTFTLGAEDPAALLRNLEHYTDAHAIKLKLDGSFEDDAERVRTVRSARPDAWLAVDANQAYDTARLDALVAMLVDQRVSLLEQPLKRGEESALAGWTAPLPIAADESILDADELAARGEMFQIVNIKLDKCGGLTEGLRMAELAKRMGIGIMVGNMGGSTLSTAPAFVLAQLCDIVDLDGPSFLADDPLAASLYSNGCVTVPDRYWGVEQRP